MTTPRLAAVLTAAALLTACGGGAQDEALPSPVPAPADPAAGGISLAGGPTAAQVDEPCPASADAVVEGQPTGAVVRADAVRARVCLHGLDGAVPSPTLLDGERAAALAAAHGDLRPVDPDQVCTLELGPTVSVLLSYADGSAVAVVTELYGCSVSRLFPGQEPPLSGGPALRTALDAVARP